MIVKQMRAYLALCRAARQNGISVRQMVREIERMSREAYDTALREGEQAALTAWNEIPRKGEHPAVLELVSYLAEQLQGKT